MSHSPVGVGVGVGVGVDIDVDVDRVSMCIDSLESMADHEHDVWSGSDLIVCAWDGRYCAEPK